MRFLDVIMNKRLGKKLSHEEIDFFIKGIEEKSIPDYQVSSFLMAVFFQGMAFDETAYLTKKMVESGVKADLSFTDLPTADKHSTGGVGDKISIILAPVVAACGVPVGMMSGRGLGHTGGTLDKLEAIPGFSVDYDLEHYYKLVKENNVAMIGQTKQVAVADKYLYSMRDATATVESIPLISSSIMSKKIAEGTNNLVIDLKVGKGAFMKKTEDAKKLGKFMIEVGKQNGVNTRCLLTNMDEPLGFAIGNSNEIIECINILKGEVDIPDVYNLTIELSAHMVALSKNISVKDARKECVDVLENGKALEKFKDMVKAQGGDPRVVNDYSLFKIARYSKDVKLSDIDSSINYGVYIESIDAYKVGVASTITGAGRNKKEDSVSHCSGIQLLKKKGDKVNPNDVLCTIFSEDEDKLENSFKILKEGYSFSSNQPDEMTLIYEVLE